MHDTELLAELVERKHQVLVELAALGRRQLDLIAREQMSELLALLETKQVVLTGLQEVERELAPFRGLAAAERTWRNPADRLRCQQLLTRCETLLAETLQQEKASERGLLAFRDAAARRLDGAHHAGLARTAYRGYDPAAARQLDLSSEGL